MGLDQETYRTLIRTQVFCPICLQRPKKWHLDHDHETGKFRGLLCSSCNIAIGLLKEDPKIFARAALYVRGKLNQAALVQPPQRLPK